MKTDAAELLSSDSKTQWQAVYALCLHVARYFAEPLRADLASDAALHVMPRIGKVKAAGNPKAYLETVAFNKMRSRARHWRKQGCRLEGVAC